MNKEDLLSIFGDWAPTASKVSLYGASLRIIHIMRSTDSRDFWRYYSNKICAKLVEETCRMTI